MFLNPLLPINYPSSILLYLDFGSIASRRPSPIKLMHITVANIHKPGGIHSHGRCCKLYISLAYWIRFPQVGTGGATPSPRKDRALSCSIAEATAKVALTTMYPTVFGIKCLQIIFEFLIPI